LLCTFVRIGAVGKEDYRWQSAQSAEKVFM